MPLLSYLFLKMPTGHILKQVKEEHINLSVKCLEVINESAFYIIFFFEVHPKSRDKTFGVYFTFEIVFFAVMPAVFTRACRS